MNEPNLSKLADAVLGRIFVELEASGRHVHITEAQAKTLFGHALTPERPLSQPGQYLAKERVTVQGPKGAFRNVAVLGPARGEAQVEISLTDGVRLKNIHRVLPKSIPRSFMQKKLLFSEKKRLSIIAKMNIGQKSSFMCSQVDSFTPENGATIIDSFVQSYKKCKTVPTSDVTAKPMSCHKLIDFFKISPHF